MAAKAIQPEQMHDDLLVRGIKRVGKELSLAMFDICHLYRTKGKRLLWQNNQFLAPYRLFVTPLSGPFNWQKGVMMLKHLKVHPWRFPIRSPQAIRTLSFICDACEAVGSFPVLETLEIDVVIDFWGSIYVGRLRTSTDALPRACRIYARARQSILSGQASTGRNLMRITVTGMPPLLLSCAMVKLLSTMLRAGGVLALGRGRNGHRYEFVGFGIKEIERKPVLEEIHKTGIDQFIEREESYHRRLPVWWERFKLVDEKERDECYNEWLGLVHMCEELEEMADAKT